MNDMFRVFIVALGGAIGSVLRYAVGSLDARLSLGVFPVGTLAVNVSGSLIIGFLWGLFDRGMISPAVRSFIFIGLLGGYTTFSTFSLETFNLMRNGEYRAAVLNIGLSVGLSILGVCLGFVLSRTALAVYR